MMTELEKQTMTAIISINRKAKNANQIDWEQRRYEIAKEIFARCLSSEDGDMRAFCARELDMTANDCVREANALIKALKEQPPTMNKDYAYCVGPNYFGGPALCQNCKRHIPFSTEVKETLTWTMPMYDEKTGTCPLHEPKDNTTTDNE